MFELGRIFITHFNSVKCDEYAEYYYQFSYSLNFSLQWNVRRQGDFLELLFYWGVIKIIFLFRKTCNVAHLVLCQTTQTHLAYFDVTFEFWFKILTSISIKSTIRFFHQNNFISIFYFFILFHLCGAHKIVFGEQLMRIHFGPNERTDFIGHSLRIVSSHERKCQVLWSFMQNETMNFIYGEATVFLTIL